METQVNPYQSPEVDGFRETPINERQRSNKLTPTLLETLLLFGGVHYCVRGAHILQNDENASHLKRFAFSTAAIGLCMARGGFYAEFAKTSWKYIQPFLS